MLSSTHYYSDGTSGSRASVSPLPGGTTTFYANGSVLTPDTSAASSSSANGSGGGHFCYDDESAGATTVHSLHPFHHQRQQNNAAGFHHAYYSSADVDTTDAGGVRRRRSRHRSAGRRPDAPNALTASRHSHQYQFHHSPIAAGRRSASIIRLNDAKHFHYDSVEIGPITIELVAVNSVDTNNNQSGNHCQDKYDGLLSQKWTFNVENGERKWLIRRSVRELAEFDRQLHRCVFERRHSRLIELSAAIFTDQSPLLLAASASSASTSGFASSISGASAVVDMPLSLAHIVDTVHAYLDRLSQLTGSLMTCYPVLKFLELDSRGNHFVPIESSSINTPAIAVAIVVRDFDARSSDQLSLRVGDIVSIVEMNPVSEDGTCYWRGKLTVPHIPVASQKRRRKSERRATRSGTSFDVTPHGSGESRDENRADLSARRPFQIGCFPRECVRIFTGKLDFDTPPDTSSRPLDDGLKRRHRKLTPPISAGNASPSPNTASTGSVRSCYGVKTRLGRWQSEKRRPLIKSLLNIFLDSAGCDENYGSPMSSPSSGRVFGVDLQTHLRESEREVPLVLTSCINVVENHGIVTGIYRQCGIQSNIRRLRWEFDNGMQPNLLERGILCDIHCVASLLKQYFRQLPNPLFTYELYDDLLRAYGRLSDDSPPDADDVRRISRRTVQRICALQDVVRRLPAPHFRTAICLLNHLSRISKFKEVTDMTASNLAIVWAPNLLRSPPQKDAANDDVHLLLGLDVHKSLCTFLITHAASIFGPRRFFDSDDVRLSKWTAALSPPHSAASDSTSSVVAIQDGSSRPAATSDSDGETVRRLVPQFVSLRHIDDADARQSTECLPQKAAAITATPLVNSREVGFSVSAATLLANEGPTKLSTRWRGNALRDFGRTVRDSIIQPLQMVARRRRHATVVTASRDETMPITEILKNGNGTSRQPTPPLSCNDVLSKYNHTVAHNSGAAFRNRMMKHSSVSPSLMRRPMPLLQEASAQTSTQENGAAKLLIHKTRRHNSQRGQRGEHLINGVMTQKHRSSLLIPSNFENVDENVELNSYSPKATAQNSTKICGPGFELPSSHIRLNVSSALNDRLDSNRQFVGNNSDNETVKVDMNNNHKCENNAVANASGQPPTVVADSPKERRIKTISMEISSSESLPLDVSRYDNVTPQGPNVARIPSRARAAARRPRPASTPLACADTPPLPTADSTSPKGFSPPAIVTPYQTLNKTKADLYYF